MKRVNYALVLTIVVITLVWLVSNPLIFSERDKLILQRALVEYTGVLSLGILSVSMLVTTRFTWLNNWLGGLDKAYRLHKWLGISGLIISFLHWGSVNLPKIVLNWEELIRPGPQTNPILEFFRNQYNNANEVGDVIFKVFVLLVLLALIKWFPYKYFYKTHRLLAIVYLLLVFHSVILMNYDNWDSLLAPVMIVLMIGGTVSAFMSLFRKIGKTNKVSGVIDELIYLKENKVLKITIALNGQWPGHTSGQFAFLRFDTKEGGHPYTISSPWTNNGKIFFLVKSLGDYTKDLHRNLKLGQDVVVEGPYGAFNFNSGKSNQIWVAGGIGIAPFMSRIKELAKIKGDKKQNIDLFYSTDENDLAIVDKLNTAAEMGNIRLHVVIPSRDGRLNFDKIKEAVPKWREGDIWFCGPDKFGRSLKKDATASGIPKADFHQELYEIR